MFEENRWLRFINNLGTLPNLRVKVLIFIKGTAFRSYYNDTQYLKQR